MTPAAEPQPPAAEPQPPALSPEAAPAVPSEAKPAGAKPALPAYEDPIDEQPLAPPPLADELSWQPAAQEPFAEELPEQAPLEQAPLEQPSLEQTPLEHTPLEQTPLEQTPLEQAPLEQAPPQQPPVEPPRVAAPEPLPAHESVAGHDPAPVGPPDAQPPRRTPSTSPAPLRGGALPPPPPLPPELGGRGGGPRRSRSRRSLLARLAALVALAAVVVAVVLVVHSLGHSEPTKTVAAPVVEKVLVPEGKTRAQIAEIAAAENLGGSYADASKRSPLLDPSAYGAPHGTPDLEGFLFPATYDMNPGEASSRLVEEQLIAFHENFGQTEIDRARALHVTPYQLLTIASMVEREAQVPGDRSKIAAVIYNRLHAGMPLGIDASIYYAVELEKGISTYTHELTEADLHIDSPYNTRTHVGLPPTPISNPGDASIHAAAYPAKVSYLYYVAAADGCGEQVFSNTLSEFEVDVAAYQAAVKKNGGHPPSCKHR